MSAVRADFRAAFGVRDVVVLTLDALRHDVAVAALDAGRTPTLAALCGAWERRHSPATFTLPAHEAFFAGFFPNPESGPEERPLALRFAGSRSVGRRTLVLDGPCLVRAFSAAGYHTICVGGTGFFNPATALGAALPSRFAEAHWSRELGVSSPRSPRAQLHLAAARLAALPPARRAFLFVNVSATHPPTRIFQRGATAESGATQAAALAAVDRALPPLLAALRARGGAVGVVCADHGTLFGEDGLWGHRRAHPAVWTVPYAEFDLGAAS